MVSAVSMARTCPIALVDGSPSAKGLAEPLLLFPLLGREDLGREVRSLEHLANLDLGLATRVGLGATLDPFDRLFPRLHLDHPEAGDQLLRLGEGPVGDGALPPGKPDARALRARLEPLAREQDAGLRHRLVVSPHRGDELPAR